MAALNVNNALLQQLLLSMNQSRPVAQTPADPVYSYRVRIISPTRKSDVIVRQIHRVTSKFISVGALSVMNLNLMFQISLTSMLVMWKAMEKFG